MPFALSPGVTVVEKDFSSIVPAVSTSAGAFCGPFAWGPIEDPVRISSETELVTRFGKPSDSNYQSFFTAANFLSYTNNLLVVRADATNLKNAVSSKSAGVSAVTLTSAGSGYLPGTPGEVPTVSFSAPQLDNGVVPTAHVTYQDATVNSVTTRTITGVVIDTQGSGYTSAPTVTISSPAAGVAATATVSNFTVGGTKIKNISSYLSTFNSGSTFGEFAAKFAGSKGNGLRVVVVDAGSWTNASTAIKNQFSSAPGTSQFAASAGIKDDEVHVLVFDNAFGSFSGVANSVLEKYQFLSKLSDARLSDGTNNYYKSVINSQSKYVWWMGHPTSSKLSAPTNVNVVNNTIGATAVFSATNKTITISAAEHFTYLAAFKAFYDAAPDKSSVKINVSSTTYNNSVFSVSSVTTTLNAGNISSYVIGVVETPVAETESTTSITVLPKINWGVNLETAGASTHRNLSVLSANIDSVLSGGVDDFASSDANILNGYSLLTNSDQYDISLVPVGNVSAATAKAIVDNLAEVRKDCLVFISPRNSTGDAWITSTGSTATAAIISYRNDTAISSSYAVIDSGWKYQYDRYNDAYRWVPLNGDIAGLCARTDYTADPWYSPGGFNRGQVKNVVKLGFNPSQADRDALYQAGINPVVSFPGQGVVLYGDKTMLAKPSAFDRINVRRLFIVLEKSIAVAAKYQMFEFNDSFTRAQFKNLVEPFLRDVQGRRGVTDFRVKCDETNNTGEVIDRNEFVADIFIKPNRSINFITLNFVAARTSVSFEEIGA